LPEAQIEAIKRGVFVEEVPVDEGEDDDKEHISPNKMLKILDRSLKFLMRSSDRLAKDIDAANRGVTA
jgi:hypothetical protein